LTFAEYTSMDDKERREYNEKAAAIRIEADRQRESADNEDEEGK